MRLQCWLFVVVATLVPAVVGGCGAATEGPELAPVEGTIRYRGQPLDNAQVVFLPETPGVPLAFAITDGDGHYELMTDVPGDGAVVGKHRVSVTARGPEEELPAGEQIPGLPEVNFSEGPPLIPETYFSFDTSGLTATVTSDGNTIDFELTEQ